MKAKDWRPTSFIDTAPGVMSGEEADVALTEQRRTFNEFLRHLMTLDAGALVLVASLIGKAFVQPVHRAAVAVAVAAFLLSLIGGAVAYLVLSASGPRVGARGMSLRDRGAYLVTLMLMLCVFLIGMSALGWFFLANWFR